MGAAGRYQLEAAVQSAHAARRLTGRTDWAGIVQLYDALLGLSGSVVVAVNRALALGMDRGAAEGLAALDALHADARFAEYQAVLGRARGAPRAHRADDDAGVLAWFKLARPVTAWPDRSRVGKGQATGFRFLMAGVQQGLANVDKHGRLAVSSAEGAMEVLAMLSFLMRHVDGAEGVD